MSLSLVPSRLTSTILLQRLAFRAASTANQPPPATRQLTVNEVGHFNYARDTSRDKRYSNPAKPGDTPIRFLTRKLGHAYELYPLFVLMGVVVFLLGGITYYSFSKLEVWLDRSNTVAPWDWERIRENYWKKPTLLLDPEGISHRRIPLLEELQDEMVEAAKKRGTR